MFEIGVFSSAQGDGTAPEELAVGAAPGESGVMVNAVRYRGGAHFEGTLRAHVVSVSPAGLLHCRFAGEAVSHEARESSIAILPAGLDAAADSNDDITTVQIAIDPAMLSLAATEGGAFDGEVKGTLCAYDLELASLGRLLAEECGKGFPLGALFWNETSSRFIDAVAARHTTGHKRGSNGRFDAVPLQRLRDYILAHLDEPLDVATLAAMCGRSQFHFSRVFARLVGVSPYRYVARLRLQRAVELVRQRRQSLADIAAATGYADQSHLTRWVRRVYGVTPTNLLEK